MFSVGTNIKEEYSLYDSDMEYNCEENQCDSICRCGVVTNVRLTLNGTSDLMVLFNKTYTGVQNSVDTALWFWWLKQNYTSLGCEFEATSSYYGEELETVFIQAHGHFDQESFDKLSTTEKLHHVLKEEYGGNILPQLASVKEWELRPVFLSSIQQSSNTNFDQSTLSTYQKFVSFCAGSRDALETFQTSILPLAPLCLPTADNKKLRIMDGRHRFEAIKSADLYQSNSNKKTVAPAIYMFVICPKGTTIL